MRPCRAKMERLSRKNHGGAPEGPCATLLEGADAMETPGCVPPRFTRPKRKEQAMATSAVPSSPAATAEPLIKRKAWKALQDHYQEMRDVHLRKLFADNPKPAASA